MANSPSPNGSNGRDSSGRFAHGNRGGPGNPNAKRAARLRAMLFKAVTPDDLRAVVSALLAQAKSGDVAAAKELFQRLLGPPEAVDLLERMVALEQQISEMTERRGGTWRN